MEYSSYISYEVTSSWLMPKECVDHEAKLPHVELLIYCRGNEVVQT